MIGLLLALNSASSYIAAFSRSSNSIYEVEEGRPIWKLKPAQIGTTLVLILLLVIVIGGVAVTGPIAEQVGNLIGAGWSFATVFDLAKIPHPAVGGRVHDRLPLLGGAQRQAARV